MGSLAGGCSNARAHPRVDLARVDPSSAEILASLGPHDDGGTGKKNIYIGAPPTLQDLVALGIGTGRRAKVTLSNSQMLSCLFSSLLFQEAEG